MAEAFPGDMNRGSFFVVQFTPLLAVFLILTLLRWAMQWAFHRMNRAYLEVHGDRVPAPLADMLDEEKFRKSTRYAVDSSRLAIRSTLAQQGFFLILLLSGFLPELSSGLGRRGMGPIGAGLAFFFALWGLQALFRLPFEVYGTFGIENRYGFNTRTWKIWLGDLMKSALLSGLLGGGLIALLLALVLHLGVFWWIWGWILVSALEWLIIWLYPVWIAPLFNKFEPVGRPDLEEGIRDLADRAGLKVAGIFRMDASKRSRHTNAYFTGFGSTKRVVLFDTLLDSHSPGEILAILAHEIGHWRRGHLWRNLALAELLSGVGFYLTARLLDWGEMYRTFGFASPSPYIGFFLVWTLLGPVLFFSQPLGAAYSRRLERQADDFARKMVQAEPLCRALKRLAAHNLANLLPHPLYAWFYFTHPPLLERLRRLRC